VPLSLSVIVTVVLDGLPSFAPDGDVSVTVKVVARLDATTGLADPFSPNANSDVFAIAVQTDGKVVAGGVFLNIGGQPRKRIARVDGTTGAADSFDPNGNGRFRAARCGCESFRERS
jgi:hypothetical protein